MSPEGTPLTMMLEDLGVVPGGRVRGHRRGLWRLRIHREWLAASEQAVALYLESQSRVAAVLDTPAGLRGAADKLGEAMG